MHVVCRRPCWVDVCIGGWTLLRDIGIVGWGACVLVWSVLDGNRL